MYVSKDRARKDKRHQNKRQCRIIYEVFDKLNYKVDVCHFKDRNHIDYSRYDVIFGFGHPMENSFLSDTRATKIYYATDTHYTYRDLAEINRVKKLFKRTKEVLRTRRFTNQLYPSYLSTALSDGIITTGNRWNVELMSNYYDGPISSVNLGVKEEVLETDIKQRGKEAKSNFLWIGGSGLVFKGLDLCIEVFAKLEEFNLHICGKEEKHFFDIYREIINSSNNINYYGFCDTSGKEFMDIVKKCRFVIYPGAAEAGCGAVLTAMGYGLIPLVTRETSIDVEKRGFYINDNIVDIIDTVKLVSRLPESELANMEKESKEFIRSNHNFGEYERTLAESLTKIINSSPLS